MLTVITFKWGTKYTSAHVNILYRALTKHLHVPFQMVCYTDDAYGLDSMIDSRPIWENLPFVTENYRKLKVFDPSIAEEFDYNYLLLDIDSIITNDISILANANNHILWKSPSIGRRGYVLNTSIVRIVNDSFNWIWTEFLNNHNRVIYQAKSVEGWVGSDQAVVSYFMKEVADTVSEEEGFISVRDYQSLLQSSLPEHIRFVSFYGKEYGDPNDPALREQYPWIEEHWMCLASESDKLILSSHVPVSGIFKRKKVTSLQHPKIIKPVNTTKKVLREPAFASDPLTELGEVIRCHNIKKLRMKPIVSTRHPDDVYNEIMVMLKES